VGGGGAWPKETTASGGSQRGTSRPVEESGRPAVDNDRHVRGGLDGIGPQRWTAGGPRG
jgi:hypothetical protein